MTLTQLAAAGAAAAGVFGAWYAALWVQATGGRGELTRILGAVETGTASERERRLLVAVVAATLGAAGWLIAGVWMACLAALCAPAGVRAWAARRRRRLRRQIADGMPTAARAIADALTGGHTLTASLQQAASSTGGPAAAELRRTAQLTELGMPVDDAIVAMRGRAGDRGWESMATAILIQREVGGDLAGLLRVLAGAVEAGDRAEATARASLSQARATARLIAGLPVLALAGVAVFDPGTIGAIVASPIAIGLMITSAGLAAMAAGALLTLARSVDVA